MVGKFTRLPMTGSIDYGVTSIMDLWFVDLGWSHRGIIQWQALHTGGDGLQITSGDGGSTRQQARRHQIHHQHDQEGSDTNGQDTQAATR